MRPLCAALLLTACASTPNKPAEPTPFAMSQPQAAAAPQGTPDSAFRAQPPAPGAPVEFHAPVPQQKDEGAISGQAAGMAEMETQDTVIAGNCSQAVGNSPGATSRIAGGKGERLPSENELAGARFQGKHVATIAKKLATPAGE